MQSLVATSTLYLLTFPTLEIGHWNAVGNNLYLFSHAGENSPKQRGNDIPLTLPSVSPVSASSWGNLNSIQNHNCKWTGKIDLFFFVLIFLPSVVEESTLGGWGNGSWVLINHIPQTGFSAALWFWNYFFYFHYSLLTHFSSHYLITKIILIFWGAFMPLCPSFLISF